MKKLLFVLLALAMFLPALALPSSAEECPAVTSDMISDPSRRNYVNAMIEYHLSEKGEKLVSDSLKNGRSAIFFFEGASDNALQGSGYSDYEYYRFAAACVVVRLVDGSPEIVFYDGFSSTIPDNPRAAYSRDEAIATLLDGVYPVINCNHYGYAALHVPAYDWGTAVRCTVTEHYTDVCYGINIHNRDTDFITPTSKNSLGCIIVAKNAAYDKNYNKFMLAVTGIENARQNSFSEVALDCGCVIIDRALYKNELRDIYDTGAGDHGVVVNRLVGYTESINSSARKYIPDPEPTHESSKAPEESSKAPEESSKIPSEPAETTETPSENTPEMTSEIVSEFSEDNEKSSISPLGKVIIALEALTLVALIAVLITALKKYKRNEK